MKRMIVGLACAGCLACGALAQTEEVESNQVDVHDPAMAKDGDNHYLLKPRYSKMTTTDKNAPIVEQRADPFIYRHSDGYYYFTGSVPLCDRIELRRSKTIDGLKDAETFDVWFKHESGPMSRHVWAPEIHYLDGKWYIYFAASEEEDIWKLRPYVLVYWFSGNRTKPVSILENLTASFANEFSVQFSEGQNPSFQARPITA